MAEYNPKEIEAKWQKFWEENGVFEVDEKAKGDKRYILDMFPYPSGDGLHVGHVKIYTASDVVSRYWRMRGKNVLHPMGWDAFGLPTENSAIKQQIHPAELTRRNVKRFKQQMKMMGFSYDWTREINTTDPKYVKWTQWIWLQLYEAGLAYEDTVPINWCPSCKTGLANEEVVDGNCDRCGTKVVMKPLRQWMLKITDYADRLLAGLDDLDWPNFIKELQRNWIGRSEGINFKEKVKDLDIEFEVYDSIPQTFLAQTFTVIAPEHPMLEKLVAGTEQEKEVREFVKQIGQRKAEGKFDLEKDLEGVFTGRYVDNPFGTGDLPIWVASYVLADYGTGIVNASAHDDRDFAFAKKYDIPLKIALLPENKEEAVKVQNLEQFYREPDGIMQTPEEVKGMTWDEAREPVIKYIAEKGWGVETVNYRLRDWVFSRQRYWGEPIPIIHCERCGVVPVPEEDLPVQLPEVEQFKPTEDGESPLAKIDEWVNVECPKCEGVGKRETNTMPQWAGSSWYWLRFLDPDNDKALAADKKMKDWLPVDEYIGGAEHAVLHLLYARFWNMVLYDKKHVPNEEPFQSFKTVGLLLGEDGQKMSKSRGNVVNPDDVVERFGADAVRVYEMFMGPFGNSMPWSDESLAGASRFVQRVWNMYQNSPIPNDPAFAKASAGRQFSMTDDLNLKMHQTIKRVTESTENFRFNTAISAMMELLNEIALRQAPTSAKATAGKQGGNAISKDLLETFLLLLAPYAPHMAEELWEKLGHNESISYANWPEYDKKLLAAAKVTIPVQVNGKVRGELTLDPGSAQEEVEAQTRELENVQKYLTNTDVKKVIYVEGKMINFVVG